MPDRLQSFINESNDAIKTWNFQIGQPYVRAYDTAFTSFKATIDAQKEADKQRAELFVTAMSIVTCSVLMGTLAAASYRVVAAKAALEVICRFNMNRTLALYDAAEQSKTFMFALGKILDEVKTAAAKQIKDYATNLMQSNDNLAVSMSPVSQASLVSSFLDSNLVAAHKSATAIENDHMMSDAQKTAHYKTLRAAPLMQPPATKLDEIKLAKKIELCMFLTKLMDTDSLVDVPYRSNFSGTAPAIVQYTSKPIDKMPSDPAYPHPVTPKDTFFGTPSHQYIGYDQLGSGIQARIDALHRDLYGAPFFPHHSFLGGPDAAESARNLVKAEGLLKQLARETHPMSVSDLRLG